MGPRELGDAPRFLSGKAAIMESRAHRVSKGGDIVGRNHTAPRAAVPLAAAVAAGDHGGGSGQSCLEGNQAKGLPHGRMHQEIGGRIRAGQLVTGAYAPERHSSFHGGEEARESVSKRTHELEVDFREPGEELNEKMAALLGAVAPHEEKTRAIARALLRGRCATLGDAVRYHSSGPREVPSLAGTHRNERARLVHQTIAKEFVEQ